MQTTIVVPCFNEAQRLDVGSFVKFVDGTKGIHFLMVNDGSHDETLEVLATLRSLRPARFDIQDLETNRGKAEAVRRGMLRALSARPAYFGYWDADLATPLEAICDFLRVLQRHGGIDAVLGSRIPLLGRDIQRQPLRRILGRMFARTASYVLGLSLHDTQCGAKLFRVTHETAALFSSRFHARWIFDVEILARFTRMRRGARTLANSVYELPLDRWRDVPGSKLRPRDFVVAVAEMAQIYWRYFGPRASGYAIGEQPRVFAPPLDAPCQLPKEERPTTRKAA